MFQMSKGGVHSGLKRPRVVGAKRIPLPQVRVVIKVLMEQHHLVAVLWSALSGIKSNLLNHKIEPPTGLAGGRKWR